MKNLYDTLKEISSSDEIWLPFKRCANIYYSVSNKGRFSSGTSINPKRHKGRGWKVKIISPYANKKGYMLVRTKENGITKHYQKKIDMKTLEQIAKNYKSQTIDGRNINRLVQFIPFDMLEDFGLQLKDGVTKEEWNKKVIPFTRENILRQLEEDVDFGFEKALNRRGISSGLMYECVRMWNWILEEGLEDFDEYPMYGLPLFKATAVKYGFDNPIGDDNGDEEEYNE